MMFSMYFEIPYRTMQNWELGLREYPDYLLKLMEYKLIHEGLIKEDTSVNTEPSQ